MEIPKPVPADDLVPRGVWMKSAKAAAWNIKEHLDPLPWNSTEEALIGEDYIFRDVKSTTRVKSQNV